jgi:hypothetical protein
VCTRVIQAGPAAFAVLNNINRILVSREEKRRLRTVRTKSHNILIPFAAIKVS